MKVSFNWVVTVLISGIFGQVWTAEAADPYRALYGSYKVKTAYFLGQGVRTELPVGHKVELRQVNGWSVFINYGDHGAILPLPGFSSTPSASQDVHFAVGVNASPNGLHVSHNMTTTTISKVIAIDTPPPPKVHISSTTIVMDKRADGAVVIRFILLGGSAEWMPGLREKVEILVPESSSAPTLSDAQLIE